MKNLIQYIIDGVLVVAVIVLFVLVLTCRNSKCCKTSVAMGDSTSVSIAYVRMDTLMNNWNLYEQLNQEFIKSEEDMRLNLKQKTEAFQKEVADFQQKIQNGIYSTQQRAQSEQDRLVKKEAQLQQLSEKLQMELAQKNQNMTVLLKSKIDSAVSVYNADGRYKFIISDSGNTILLYGDEACDVTEDLLEILNKD